MEIKRKQIKDSNGQLRNTTIWQIEVDGKSETELVELFGWAKNMLGNIRSQNGEYSKNKRSADTFDACMKIYNTDVSHLYDSDDDTKKYYVYAHCDPSKKIAIGKHGITSFAATLGLQFAPFYIGMGNGNRAFELDRNETHRKYRQKIQKTGKDAVSTIIVDNLTKTEALAIESKLIDIFGLIVNKGFLVNLDEGKSNKERVKMYTDELIKIGRFNPYK